MSIGTISPSWKHLLFKYFGILSSIIGSLAWLATIVTLFALWAVDDFIRYEPTDGQVTYISKVGGRHKTVFIIGAAITGTFFVVTLIFNKICFDIKNQRRFKRCVSIASIIFGIIAGVSLLLLSIFDSINHTSVHYTFTGLFFVCTIISAILTIVYRYTRNEINLSVYIRVSFVSLVVPLAITYVIMLIVKYPNDETQLKSVSASIEWSVAILFIFYLISFALDLLLYN